MKNFTVELTIKNQYGAINRITSLYMKRRFEIRGLNIELSDNKEYVIMQIKSSGDEKIQKQTLRQLNKLYDVMDSRIVLEN